jgi:hypothetical protein
MAKVTTVRLPADVDEALADYCRRAGATRNRVHVLALRSWLGDGPVPAAPVQPPDDHAREAAAARALIVELDREAGR